MKLKQTNKRRLLAIKEFLTNPFLRKKKLQQLVSHLYESSQKKHTLLKTLRFTEAIPNYTVCQILPYPLQDGNTSYLELLIISSLIKTLKPKKLLEIGTFNGLTTLHMALNSEFDAEIHTLDLTTIEDEFLSIISPEDLKFIINKDKDKKIFYNFKENKKIIEHKGNSLTYDFNSFGKVDWIFIDGGHGFEVVKNDTIKAFSILNKGGCIVWHDYNPNCKDVFDYLNFLSKDHQLSKIENTSLVIYKKEN